MIEPKKREYANLLINREICPLVSNQITSQTKQLISLLFNNLIIAEVKYEENRSKLNTLSSFSSIDAYGLILCKNENDKGYNKQQVSQIIFSFLYISLISFYVIVVFTVLNLNLI